MLQNGCSDKTPFFVMKRIIIQMEKILIRKDFTSCELKLVVSLPIGPFQINHIPSSRQSKSSMNSLTCPRLAKRFSFRSARC